jgi:hypothetical protein
MTKKQTAVEWLVDQVDYDQILHPYYINQALEMEKEQIIAAYQAGDRDAYKMILTDKWADQYYEETFRGVDD